MPLDQLHIEQTNKVTDDKEMSFLDHLEELRWHLIRSIVAIIVVAIVVFVFKEAVFDVVLGPKYKDFFTYRFICGLSETLCFYPPDFKILPRELGEAFITHMKASIFIGLILVFPYVFWEIWRFIKPGLQEEESKAASGVVWVCSFLFATGVLFGYFVIAPFAVTFLASYHIGEDVTSSPTLASFVNYMVMFTIPTGVTFQLPLVIYFLSKVGLVTPAFLKKYRRHAFVVLLILAAIVTPPDLITQFLIAVPLYFLFEASILISARVEKNRKT